ncbi:hypothetical protein HanRHA438_Chr04g0150201 [Helianthus annuus]|uniref:Uncharacterized protein n=1 Tax=Helianthus annuus TaxID=4232 RepID=A0A9K3J2Z7_HELAN|nr:hypothetical protein HanXRQr2_Chr04g0138741 [Helianthus annuus]KAJ0924586.1 hypothetical protein HanRHA438_Chr04g0150201 [Helianthus annuus]KAJ0929224.1 hypothetical protein HanPSC8_Chr04g0135311 [Helianthus annuus]
MFLDTVPVCQLTPTGHYHRYIIAHTCHPPAFTTENHRLAPNTLQATNISTVYLLRQTWKSITERDREKEKERRRWLLFPPPLPTGNGIS